MRAQDVITKNIPLGDIYILSGRGKNGYAIRGVTSEMQPVTLDESSCIKSDGVLNEGFYDVVSYSVASTGNRCYDFDTVLKQYVITLIDADGYPIDDSVINYGGNFEVPQCSHTIPEGYEFGGWVDEYNTIYQPQDIIEGVVGDIQLKEVLNPIYLTVTFVSEDENRVFYDDSQVVSFQVEYGTEQDYVLQREPIPTYIDDGDYRQITLYDDNNHLVVWNQDLIENVYSNSDSSEFGSLSHILPAEIKEDITVIVKYHRRISLSLNEPVSSLKVEGVTNYGTSSLYMYIPYNQNMADTDAMKIYAAMGSYDAFDYWLLDGDVELPFPNLSDCFVSVSDFYIEDDVTLVANGIEAYTLDVSFYNNDTDESFLENNTIVFNNYYDFPDGIVRILPNSETTIGNLLGNYVISIGEEYTIDGYYLSIGGGTEIYTQQYDFAFTADGHVSIAIALEEIQNL